MTRSGPEPIQGRVAQLLNIRELVINVGSKDGVERGMKFAVLAAEPLVIKDPLNGEELGTIDREKIRVEVTEVHERFAVCATYETVVAGGGIGMPSVADLL